jgi:AcrR family transcriptional regulator
MTIASTRRNRQPRARRTYRQDFRARQTRDNTDRIVETAARLIKTTQRTADITLDDVSRESGLTVRTILRRFGSRDGVLEAAFARIKTEFEGLRVPTRAGDVDAALTSLLNQYERIGDLNIRALEQEEQLPLLRRALSDARRIHRAWLEEVFAPNLAALPGDERERRLIALYAATDVYLWKLLRRDLNLDRPQTEQAYRRLVYGVLGSDPPGRSKKGS